MMAPIGEVCRVMGILNVTPDSFSDGGRWVHSETAIARGVQMMQQGAAIVDVGGESTRPGATRPSEAEELSRVLPVVAGLASAGVTVSIDTMRATVARACVEAGASVVNDVSGGLADPTMLPVMAELGVTYVCMHWRGHGDHMHEAAVYHDVVAEVRSELNARADACLAAGIRPDHLVLDPGFGFAKNADHNWTLLRACRDLTRWGFPVLVGVSRKRFLGDLPGAGEPADRDVATAVISHLAAVGGAWGVRVHDVPGSVQAVGLATILHLPQATATEQKSPGSCA